MKHHFRKEETEPLKTPETPVPPKNRKKKPVIVGVFLLLAAIFTVLYLTSANDSAYKGKVEPLILPTVSEVSGKIVESEVSLGQSVKKGDVIAVIDSTNQAYEISQLTLMLEKKKLALGDITVSQGGQASNAYLSAQANYNSASVAANKASLDYLDAKSLYAQGAISNSELSKAQVAASSATSLKSAALAQLNNTLSQTGQSTAQIDVALLENQINQAQDNLIKYTLTASGDGTVISQNYSKGSVVAPGYNIADIGSSAQKYVVFYVPESQVNDIEYNQPVKITYNGETLSGKIKYIDVKSQYTPKDLQTAANKSKVSFKVKALISGNTGIKPGIEVQITLQ